MYIFSFLRKLISNKDQSKLLVLEVSDKLKFWALKFGVEFMIRTVDEFADVIDLVDSFILSIRTVVLLKFLVFVTKDVYEEVQLVVIFDVWSLETSKIIWLGYLIKLSIY